MDFYINILLMFACYVIGSIPTAYIFLKKKENIDITKTGSKNVGARNLYEITKSKQSGAIVLLIDLLKGAIPIILAIKLFDYHGFFLLIFGLALVFGHNYSCFIKFKGGRGLATAAGVIIIIFPIALPVWLLLYFVISRLISKNVHVASMAATFGMSFFVISTPSVVIFYFLNTFHNVVVSYWEFVLFSFVLSLIIASKHIQPIIETFKTKININQDTKNV
jgi:glycerol-3-phosphate acyltransferase PlsY